MSDKKKKKRTVEVTDENVFSSFDDYEPSVTWSVFVYWILPVLAIAFMSRFLVDPHAASGWRIGEDPERTKSPHKPVITTTATQSQPPTTVPTTPTIAPTPQRPKRKVTPVPTLVAEKPSSYIQAVQGISRRRLNWEETDASAMGDYSSAKNDRPKSATTTSSSNTIKQKPRSVIEDPVRGASSDPVRNQLLANIDELRDIHVVSS